MARRRGLAVAGPSRISGHLVLRIGLWVASLLVAIFLALAGLGGGLTYYVTSQSNTQESVNPQTYLLSSFISLSFTDKAGGEHDGWLLLGLRGAPVIILCHGYNSNRSDLLSLGSILRDNHYNVYIFNFQGPKTRENRSNLGSRQASDLMSAIDTVTKQPDVNPNRVGVFGTSVGGYAALVAAEQNPKVKALVVDTTYSTPEQMFDWQINRLLGGSSGFFHALTEAEFHLASMGSQTYPMQAELDKLAGMPKLFIAGHDEPALYAMTEEIWNRSPQPKKLLKLEHAGNALASESEKKEYEDQILTFFLQSLSLRAD